MSSWYFIKTLNFLKLQSEYEAKKIMIFSVIIFTYNSSNLYIDKYYYFILINLIICKYDRKKKRTIL